MAEEAKAQCQAPSFPRQSQSTRAEMQRKHSNAIMAGQMNSGLRGNDAGHTENPIVCLPFRLALAADLGCGSWLWISPLPGGDCSLLERFSPHNNLVSLKVFYAMCTLTATLLPCGAVLPQEPQT